MNNSTIKFKQTEIGEIPENWEILNLDSFLNKKNQGVNTTTERVSYSKSGVPIVRANNITDYSIDFEDLVYVDSENYSRIRGDCRPKKGDILYTNIGSQFGSAVLVINDKEFGIAWNVMRMQPNVEKILPSFLVYLLNNPKNKSEIKSLNSSSTMPFVSGGELGKIKFAIPTIPEQKNIVSILSSLDDKIELNKKIIKNLEQTAQALFKHWFVDFEFPNESSQPYKSSGGEMIDSELGQIPKEWNILPLTNVTHIVYGKGLPTNKLLNQGYPVFGGNGQIGFYNEYLYEEPQIIIGCRGAASGNIKQTPPKSYITNNSLVLEIPQPSMLNIFYLKQYLYRIGISEYVTGSAQPQITIENLKNCPVLIPQPKYLELFCGQIKNIDLIIKKYEKEIQLITQTRDLLLPKLLSGKIRIN